jgi:hypothetical protein
MLNVKLDNSKNRRHIEGFDIVLTAQLIYHVCASQEGENKSMPI